MSYFECTHWTKIEDKTKVVVHYEETLVSQDEKYMYILNDINEETLWLIFIMRTVKA